MRTAVCDLVHNAECCEVDNFLFDFQFKKYKQLMLRISLPAPENKPICMKLTCREPNYHTKSRPPMTKFDYFSCVNKFPRKTISFLSLLSAICVFME